MGRIVLLLTALAFACSEFEGPELPIEPFEPPGDLEGTRLDRDRRRTAGAEAPLALRRIHGVPGARSTLVVRASRFARAVVGNALEAGFEAACPGLDLVLLGSTGRGAIRELVLKRAEAALVTVAPTASERSRGLRHRLLGRHVLALVVHPTNPLGSVTEHRLRRLLTGELRTWNREGEVELVLGPRGPLLDRAAKILVPGVGFSRRRAAVDSEQAVIQRVRRSPRAIGVVGLAALSRSSGLRALRVDGTTPLGKGRYPYSVELNLVWRRERSRAGQSLLDFVRSPDGRSLLGTRLTVP